MPSYSGLWDGHYGQPYAPLTQFVNKGNDMAMLTRVFGRRAYGRAYFREMIQALVGAAPGAAYQANHRRVKWTPTRGEPASGGGLVQMEQFIQAGTTTAADETMIEKALEQDSYPTYPKDKAGNGGGGKLGW